jgi:hypothetical protein
VAQQYRLIVPVMRETRASLSRPLDRQAEIDQIAALWQVVTVKELGRSGVVIALCGSLALIGLALIGGWQVRRNVRPRGLPQGG